MGSVIVLNVVMLSVVAPNLPENASKKESLLHLTQKCKLQMKRFYNIWKNVKLLKP